MTDTLQRARPGIAASGGLAPARSRWVKAGSAVVVGVMVLVLLLVIKVNSNPAQLTAADPADGAALAAAPTAVSLTFSGALDPANSHLAVGTGNGVLVANSPAEASGQTLRQPVTIVERGVYLIAYHVTLADGRELSGTSQFALTAGAAPGSTPARGNGAAALSPEQWRSNAGHQHGGVDPLSAVVLLADAAMIVFLLVVMLRRPRARGSAVTDSGRDAGRAGSG